MSKENTVELGPVHGPETYQEYLGGLKRAEFASEELRRYLTTPSPDVLLNLPEAYRREALIWQEDFYGAADEEFDPKNYESGKVVLTETTMRLLAEQPDVLNMTINTVALSSDSNALNQVRKEELRDLVTERHSDFIKTLEEKKRRQTSIYRMTKAGFPPEHIVPNPYGGGPPVGPGNSVLELTGTGTLDGKSQRGIARARIDYAGKLPGGTPKDPLRVGKPHRRRTT